MRKGELDRAIEDFTAALRVEPDYAPALAGRAHAWARKGELDRAIEDFTAALRIEPDNPEALTGRAHVWMGKRELDQAIEDFTAALRIEPDSPAALFGRGVSWDHKGELDRAVEDFTQLAWLLPTASDARLRDGPRAVTVAEKTVSLRDNVQIRDTLAAAYAEVGRFDDAVHAQEQAISLARILGWNAKDIADMEERLRLYRQGRPYRMKPAAGSDTVATRDLKKCTEDPNPVRQIDCFTRAIDTLAVCRREINRWPSPCAQWPI